ncbi:MAG: D-alanine--D-alanine ligase [Candidatus Goldiibacteriota bacterium]
MKKAGAGKKRIGVIMGGLSSEREISLLSGAAIVKELKSRGENVVAIDLKARSVEKIEKAGIDVAFIALHGTFGEDGVIQGILEFLGIPYTGSGVLASALGMNKVKTKEMLAFNKIPTAAWRVIGGKKELKALTLKYPVVFKPVSEGSSVGVYIVKNEKEALKCFSAARKYGPVLAEEFIKGKEITVPVFCGRTLPIIEIVPANEFYDYESKYTEGMSNHIIPARITAAESRLAQKTALEVHECVGCRDYSRVDMIVAGGKVCVIEINTLPGMTSLSLFPDAAKKAGISFYDMIMTLVNKALARSGK